MGNKSDESWEIWEFKHDKSDKFKNLMLVFYDSFLNFEGRYRKSWADLLKKTKDTEEYRRLKQLAEEINEAALGLSPMECCVRDAVLGSHIIIDQLINRLLTMYFVFGGNKEAREEFTRRILSRLDFQDKLSTLKKLKLLSKSSVKKADKINKVRNGFAHGYRKGDEKFDYNKGESIFKLKVMDFFKKDYDSIIKDLYCQFDKLLDNYWGNTKSKK